MENGSMMVFSGNANPALARAVASHLKIRLGDALVSSFSDGEVQVEINEHVRGHDVFIIQPTCAPTNDNLMELLVIADALRRSSAARITAVVPYYGYARQDRRQRSQRVPITAKLAADMITTAGINRVITVDLHADQIQGFFNIPVDNVYASPVLLGDIWRQTHRTRSSSRRMWAACCAPGRSPGGWTTLIWPSSTSAGLGPTSLK